MGIESWSTTAGSNNSASPNGAPEGMAPSGVNDTIRQIMASIRSWYENAQWINLGYTHTYASSTSFTIATIDYTATYHAGRRIKAVGTSTGTIYGTITSSSYSSSTTVNVSWDSGSLSNETLTISLSALTKTNDAIPYLYKKAADVASASTIDLNAIRGDLVDVTGTTTITAITLAEGQQRIIRFTGILTFTHGSSLVLPTAANITTVAGDFAIVRGYASSVVRCVGYFRADGTPLTPLTTGTNLALSGKFSTTAAGTLTIATGAVTATGSNHLIDTEGAASSDDLDTISGGVDGMRLILSLANASHNVVLKHNTGNIFNPRTTDITLDVTNEKVELAYDSSLSKWVVISGIGGIVQVVYTQTSGVATGTTIIPRDDTPPQITEGTEFMTRAITPTNSANILKIDVVALVENGAANSVTGALFQDSTANALAAGIFDSANYTNGHITFTYYMVAGTTSSTTFRFRAGPNSAATITFNGRASGRLYGGITLSSITVTEIKA